MIFFFVSPSLSNPAFDVVKYLFNRLFTEDEISTIRRTTFYDVLIAIGIEPSAIQKDGFVWNIGKLFVVFYMVYFY